MRDIVGLLDDREVREAIDDLLSSAANPSDVLMTRLLALGWKPQGEAHITLLGLMLIVHYYNEDRNKGNDIQESLSEAYVNSMNHPTIQKYMAKVTADGVDRAAGIQ